MFIKRTDQIEMKGYENDQKDIPGTPTHNCYENLEQKTPSHNKPRFFRSHNTPGTIGKKTLSRVFTGPMIVRIKDEQFTDKF